MKKYKWYLTLLILSLVVLISPAAGCITITAPEGPAPPPPSTEAAQPVINSFTATPETISSGQSATLSWDVSDAATVTIQPAIGSVSPSGAEQVLPAVTTTYTLAATNEGGSATSAVTVTVTSAAAGKPDLVVTDTWFSAIFYYKLKNQGNVDAEGSQSYIYINDYKEASDYVQPLAAGEERTESFSNFQWGPAPSGMVSKIAINIKICADADNAIAESDEDNNCGSMNYGAGFSYSFTDNAHLATWRSGAGKLKWPMVSSSSKGAAFVRTDTLYTYPEQVSHGWIQGTFGEVYSKYGETRIREIEIPRDAKFTARVGFKDGAAATGGVRVALGYVDNTGSVVLFPKMDVYYDGELHPYEVDLSDLAGKKVYFVLKVEAGESGEQDWLMWVEPKIVQE